MEETNGSFVIADIFYKDNVDYFESLFNQYFQIQKKEVITFNVKHAM